MSENAAMQTPRNKRLLAAIGVAVTNYLRTEEVSVTALPVAGSAPLLSNALSASNLYGASGRQQMMEMRRLLSLRMGRR